MMANQGRTGIDAQYTVVVCYRFYNMLLGFSSKEFAPYRASRNSRLAYLRLGMSPMEIVIGLMDVGAFQIANVIF